MPFPLQVTRFHDAFLAFAVFAQRTGLAQHGVDQRRLAMVDVRHDGDIAKIGFGRTHAGDCGSAEALWETTAPGGNRDQGYDRSIMTRPPGGGLNSAMPSSSGKPW